jgi:hypothetical protein
MTTINASGPQLRELQAKLGISEQALNSQSKLLSNSSIAALRLLRASAAEAGGARGKGALRFESMMNAEDRRLPPFGWNRSPARMQPIMTELCGSGCASHAADEASTSSDTDLLSRFFRRRRRTGAKLERLLRTNPRARAAFESQVGGNIISFERRGMKVQRFSNPAAAAAQTPSQANLPATTAMGALGQMEQAILAQARRVAAIQGQSGNSSGNSSASSLTGSGSNPTYGYALTGLQQANGQASYGSALGGAGTGSWNPNAQPGLINNTNPLYERAHQSEVDSILEDPSLTIEDKVTLMLMTVSNKMSGDVKRQAQYVNSIQQQQSNRGNKGNPLAKVGGMSHGGLPGMGGAGGFGMSSSGMAGIGNGMGFPAPQLGGPAGSQPSIDVETMKLKRMIDKRSQMFDILRSIIDKYNETAKNIITSIGR